LTVNSGNTMIDRMASQGHRSHQPKRGRPQKLGEHQPFSIRLPADLHQQLKHYVVDHPGRSLNDLIVEAVSDWWADVPERGKYARLVEDAARKRGATETSG
jgi:hypothetical protein